MGKDYLLGVDAGTSVVKAVLFDLSGREIASALRQTELNREAGRCETSVIGTWHAFASTIRDLLIKANIAGSQIAAVGVAGNMIGAWLVDEQGKPVRDGILWCDGRTQPLIDRLKAAHPGFLSKIFATDGCVLETGCTLPQIRWLAENEPESLRRAKHIFCSKDYLCFRLTGKAQLDPTEAAGLPGDIRTQTYSDAMFALFGVEQYRPLFPPVVPSETVIGEVLPDAAAATGLQAGTPVVAGAGDVPANVLGIGAVEPGIALTVLGTNCQSGMVFDHPVFEPADVGLLFYIPGQRWYRALMNVAGTTNLDWFIDQFYAAERDVASSRAELFATLEQIASQSEPGARGIIYHPYLSTVGVIAPFVEPAARAQFFGLTVQHRRADLLRAVYEGVALAIRDCYTALNTPIREIRFAGGGSRSPLWCQIVADCLGARVVIPEGGELGAKGAALLAGVGIGQFPSIIEASKSAFRVTRSYEPNLDLKPRYDAIYKVYRMLRDDVRSAWHANAHIRLAD
ncbi:MAG: carbohydrate kinase [Anaerolineae bacterium]|nr:carbohydrate kinase [Anaerolineae bacterium]